MSARPLELVRPNHRRRRGLTIVEVMMAMVLSTGVGIGLGSLTIYGSRMLKENFSQRHALDTAKTVIELFNSQLRPANDDRVRLTGGTRIEFSWPGEPDFRRRIELLPGPDGQLATPWDNILRFDPNSTQSGDHEDVADYVSPVDPAGAFVRTSARDPIWVRIRIGDPVGATAAIQKQSDTRTGKGIQGSDIDLMVLPRNNS